MSQAKRRTSARRAFRRIESTSLGGRDLCRKVGSIVATTELTCS
jgi:hypothetical protein